MPSRRGEVDALAVCSNAMLTAELDAEGELSNYAVVGDDEVPD